MLKAITTCELFTTSQSEALAFYTEKLGFVIRTDVTNGDFRWLTIGLPAQPNLEVVLMEVKPDFRLSEEEAKTVTKLLREGKLAPSPVLDTDDIEQAYTDFTAKGVEFLTPPTAREWGTMDARFKDNSGNVWLLLQQPAG